MQSFPYRRIALRVELQGFKSVDISFELDEYAITHLLGSLVYADESACTRELLQSSVDACRRAELVRPKGWLPRIEMIASPHEKVLQISDNGIGMDEHIVRKYFSREGLSYYQSDEFDGGFRPVSRFGIGFMSSLMLADRVVIETYNNGSSPLSIEPRTTSQPYIVQDGQRHGPGSDVYIYLKDASANRFDLLERTELFARHVDVPIYMGEDASELRRISPQSVLPNRSHISEVFSDTRVGNAIPDRYFEKYATVVESSDIQIGVLLWGFLLLLKELGVKETTADGYRTYEPIRDYKQLGLDPLQFANGDHRRV